jgi:uncharacterized membrane protein YphA (DoxX/SURF4 family)
MKSKLVGYWVTTGLLALMLLSGGVFDVAQPKQVADVFIHLGYPLYFGVLLGVWKVLGGIAILVPRFPRLKEWAYAGTFFDLSGAVVSHIACHDSATDILTPVVLIAITVASWALRPPSRRLGELFSAKQSA